LVPLQYVPICIGDIIAVKNPFFHTHISRANEFAPTERAEVEPLSRIEGSLRIKDQAMPGPFGRPTSIPRSLRADTGMCPHEDVVTLAL
jgi:hypothetical protein